MVTNTDSLLEALRHVPAADDDDIHVMDIKSVYASIDQQHLLFSDSNAAFHYWSRKGHSYLARMAKQFVETVIQSQFVHHKGLLHHFIVGIATGTACGVFMANI